MSLVISTNLNSLVVQNNLATNQPQLSQAMQRLSSGLRINSAADDAAGLAIATGLNSQSGGDGVAIQNANNASSLAQIADGALASITNDLQTLRNLAVESANGTNSATDRAALNIQAQQVIADLQNSASTTNYNGVNLLNGGFSSQFQIGANAGQTINLSIANVQTSTLGAGQGTGVSAQGQAGVGATPSSSLTAISAGDLVINGVIVPASLATSDSATFTGTDSGGTITSNASAATSAIAKVAAINSVSSQSGVSAVVNSDVVGGTSMTSTTSSGTVYINGISISLNVSSTFTNDANRNAEVTAINAVAGQTGVTAVNTGSDSTGITLTAKDGRNITVDYSTASGNTLSATATGLASAGTYSGGYTLTTSNNQPINVQQGTGTLANSGLQAGSYTASQATISSTSLGNISSTSAVMASGDLVINGVSIQASNSVNDNLSYASKQASAIAIAYAINQSSAQTGVTAKVNSNVIQGSSFATSSDAGKSAILTVNGVSTQTLTLTGTLSTDLANETNAINAISGQTGVAASNNGSNITLTASDGRNVTLDYAAGNLTGNKVNTDLGLSSSYVSSNAGTSAAITTGGSYTLSSAGSITIGSTTGKGGTDAGLLEGSYGGITNGTFLSQVDISTVSGANAAIVAVDNALTTVNEIRANIGAFQNRMSATVSNLQSQQTNLTSAYTAITGADFAKETANLTRAQVLQQAGISVLSQANALSQQVLNLLR